LNVKRLSDGFAGAVVIAINVAEDEILIFGFELFGAENILLQLLAPHSPIRVEVHHYQLVGSGGGGFGFFKVFVPLARVHFVET